MPFNVKSLVGTAFCVASAIFLSLIMRDDADVRLGAPFLCVFAVIGTAFLWGRLPAILGAVSAGVTFRVLLCPPFGSFRVADPGESTILVVFQVVAIALAFLAPPAVSDGPRGGRIRNWKGGRLD